MIAMLGLALLAGICGLVTGRFGFVITGLIIVMGMFVMKFLEYYSEPRQDPGYEDDSEEDFG